MVGALEVRVTPLDDAWIQCDGAHAIVPDGGISLSMRELSVAGGPAMDSENAESMVAQSSGQVEARAHIYRVIITL